MYRDNDDDGVPARVYRSLTEIRYDISSIVERINEVRESLNIRALLLDFADRMRDAEQTEEWLPELEGLVGEAREAYDTLKVLDGELISLREELGETKWAMGV